MRHRLDRIDGLLGRMFFRAVGLLCTIVGLACAIAVLWHLTHWNDYSLVAALMFAVAGLAALSAVPYCFASNRSLGEALDVMEGGTGDPSRRR